MRVFRRERALRRDFLLVTILVLSLATVAYLAGYATGGYCASAPIAERWRDLTTLSHIGHDHMEALDGRSNTESSLQAFETLYEDGEKVRILTKMKESASFIAHQLCNGPNANILTSLEEGSDSKVIAASEVATRMITLVSAAVSASLQRDDLTTTAKGTLVANVVQVPLIVPFQVLQPETPRCKGIRSVDPDLLLLAERAAEAREFLILYRKSLWTAIATPDKHSTSLIREYLQIVAQVFPVEAKSLLTKIANDPAYNADIRQTASRLLNPGDYESGL